MVKLNAQSLKKKEEEEPAASVNPLAWAGLKEEESLFCDPVGREEGGKNKERRIKRNEGGRERG